jgi:hypothetical protein
MNWQLALGECVRVMAELHGVRQAGFTEAALAFPRDMLALKLLCAFNGCPPHLAPNGWHYFPNEATKKAWQRVADVFAADLKGVRDFLNHAPLESGVCCCGCPVEGHGYQDGHSAVDELAYAASSWVERLDQVLDA